MPKKTRLGLVPYLNAKPLIQPLLSGEVEHNCELYFAPPSQLAKALKQGSLDVGLIPAIEYASSQDYMILPDMAISADGAVRSVYLYSKKPVSEIKTVALDSASRTSAALVKIIFAQRFQRQPEYFEATPPLHEMLETTDAALIIGDKALQTPAKAHYQLDLSEEWQRLTGQAFVFAIFAARNSVHAGKVWQALMRSKALGMERIPDIARQEAVNLGLDYDLCLDYLTRRICYDLSPDKLAGLENFYKLAGKHGLIRKDVKLKFYQRTNDIRPLAPKWNLANA